LSRALRSDCCIVSPPKKATSKLLCKRPLTPPFSDRRQPRALEVSLCPPYSPWRRGVVPGFKDDPFAFPTVHDASVGSCCPRLGLPRHRRCSSCRTPPAPCPCSAVLPSRIAGAVFLAFLAVPVAPRDASVAERVVFVLDARQLGSVVGPDRQAHAGRSLDGCVSVLSEPLRCAAAERAGR